MFGLVWLVRHFTWLIEFLQRNINIMAFLFARYNKCDKQKCFASYQKRWASSGELKLFNASNMHMQYLKLVDIISLLKRVHRKRATKENQ